MMTEKYADKIQKKLSDAAQSRIEEADKKYLAQTITATEYTQELDNILYEQMVLLQKEIGESSFIQVFNAPAEEFKNFLSNEQRRVKEQ